MESNCNAVKEHIRNSGIEEFSKTDEYLPLYIANALAMVGENDEAIVWIKRAVDFCFQS